MKKLIFILFAIFHYSSYSQEPLSFGETIEIQGISKNELFLRGREWFNSSFKSSKDVLQISDKESGELSGKGNMDIYYTYRYMGERQAKAVINFQVNLWVKDGKYKFEFTNFEDPGARDRLDWGLITTSNETNKKYPGFNAKKMNEMYLSIKQSTEIKIQLLIEDLKLKMSKSSKQSDW